MPTIPFEEIMTEFFNHLNEIKDYFIPYLDRRASCEKWIQGEFIHFLYGARNRGAIQETVLEKEYGPRLGFCDIWLRSNDQEFWCELQVIVTNYGSPGKPITNQVDHVLQDTRKLNDKVADGQKYVIFFVYPLYRDSDNHPWQMHLDKIATTVTFIGTPYIIPLSPTYEMRIYLSKVSPRLEMNGVADRNPSDGKSPSLDNRS